MWQLSNHTPRQAEKRWFKVLLACVPGIANEVNRGLAKEGGYQEGSRIDFYTKTFLKRQLRIKDTVR